MMEAMRYGKKMALAAFLGAIGVLAAGSSEARAGFTVSLDGTGPVTVSPGVFQYNYTASISTDDQINSGNFFRIYNFTGLNLATIIAPTGWTVTTAATMGTPPPNVILSHGDFGPDVQFTYTGSTPVVGPISISGFSLQSSIGTVGVADFAGRDTKTSTGSFVDSVGDVTVPGVVPEPSSLISGGIGLIALGLTYGRSRRSKLSVAA